MRKSLLAAVLLGVVITIPIDVSAVGRRPIRVRVVIARPVRKVIVQESQAVVQRVVSVRPATAVITTTFRRGFCGRLRAIQTVTLKEADAAPPAQ